MSERGSATNQGLWSPPQPLDRPTPPGPSAPTCWPMASSHPAWSHWSDAMVLDDYAMTTTTKVRAVLTGSQLYQALVLLGLALLSSEHVCVFGLHGAIYVVNWTVHYTVVAEQLNWHTEARASTKFLLQRHCLFDLLWRHSWPKNTYKQILVRLSNSQCFLMSFVTHVIQIVISDSTVLWNLII